MRRLSRALAGLVAACLLLSGCTPFNSQDQPDARASAVSVKPLPVIALDGIVPDKPHLTPGCPAPAPADSVWVTPFKDDSTQPLPAVVKSASVTDHFWWSITVDNNRPAIVQHPSKRTLTAVAAASRSLNACGQRYVTLVDDAANLQNEVAARQSARTALTVLLSNDAERHRLLRDVAGQLARQPNISGLTIDLERGLPETVGDLSQFSAQGSEPRAQIADVASRFSKLVGEYRAALNHQGRQLRVVVKVQGDDVNLNYVAPHVYDYRQLAAYVDQLVLMAVDYHYGAGEPGPVAPPEDVLRDADRALRKGVPADKLAVEVPAYAYDWEVKDWNADPLDDKSTGAMAESWTATEVAALKAKYVAQHNWWEQHRADGWLYRYKGADGVLHDIWDATPVLNRLVAQLRQRGLKVAVWKAANTDPVGAQEIASSFTGR